MPVFNTTLLVRLSEQEKGQLQDLAGKANKTMSEYVRLLIWASVEPVGDVEGRRVGG